MQNTLGILLRFDATCQQLLVNVHKVTPLEKLRNLPIHRFILEINPRSWVPSLNGTYVLYSHPPISYYRQSCHYPTLSLILLLSVYEVHGCIMLAYG
jgi:hypothetical protein